MVTTNRATVGGRRRLSSVIIVQNHKGYFANTVMLAMSQIYIFHQTGTATVGHVALWRKEGSVPIGEFEKQVFQACAENRKRNGIRLKQIRLLADASQVETFHMIFDAWVQRFHKEGAVDFLLSAMCEAEAKLQEWDEAKKKAKTNGHAR